MSDKTESCPHCGVEICFAHGIEGLDKSYCSDECAEAAFFSNAARAGGRTVRGIYLCDACNRIVLPIKKRTEPPPCPHCAVGDLTLWGGEQLGAKIKALDEVLISLQKIKDSCDRDWDGETPEQIATIVSNGMFWRNNRIIELLNQKANVELQVEILNGAVNESNRRQRILIDLLRRIELECRGYDALHDWLEEAGEVLSRFGCGAKQ